MPSAYETIVVESQFFYVCLSSCYRLVRVSAGEIEKLTPLIIQATRDFRANPRDLVAVERLQTIGREWASKVHVLSGAVDEIVTPWSAAASKLALAATSGDAEELKKQVGYSMTESTHRSCIRQRQFPSLTGTLGKN